MEQVAMRLDAGAGWTRLGGGAEPKKPPEVVVRAFEGSLLAATGERPDAPDGDPVRVPQGEGRRLVGPYVFVRAEDAGPCLLSYRGVE